MVLSAYRVFFLAQDGKATEARQELEAARKAYPTASLIDFAEASMEGLLSQNGQPVDRESSLMKAATALLKAIQKDRSHLDEIYLLPELGLVRMSPAFCSGLRALLQTKK